MKVEGDGMAGTTAQKILDGYFDECADFLRMGETIFDLWLEALETYDRQLFEKVINSAPNVEKQYSKVLTAFLTTISLVLPVGKTLRKITGFYDMVNDTFNLMANLRKASELIVILPDLHRAIPADIVKMARLVRRMYDTALIVAFTTDDHLEMAKQICALDNKVDVYERAISSELLKTQTERSFNLLKAVGHIEEMGDICTDIICKAVFAVDDILCFCYNDTLIISEGHNL